MLDAANETGDLKFGDVMFGSNYRGMGKEMKRTLLVVLIIVLVGLAFAAGRCSLTKSSCHESHEKTGEEKTDEAPDWTDSRTVTDEEMGFLRRRFAVDIPPKHKLRVVWRVYIHGKLDEDKSRWCYYSNSQSDGPVRPILTLGIYDPDVLNREDSEWVLFSTPGWTQWIKVSGGRGSKSIRGGGGHARQPDVGKDDVVGEIIIGRDFGASEKPAPLRITMEIRLEVMSKADEESDHHSFFISVRGVPDK